MHAARRLLPITAVMLGWLILGIAAPLILNLRGGGFDLDHATVVAAPRHAFYVADALAIDPRLGLVIERGRLGLDASDDRATTGEARDRLIADGTARLVAENATFSLFGDVPSRGDPIQLGPLVAVVAAHKFKTLAIRNARVRLAVAAIGAADLTEVEAVLTPTDGGMKLAGQGQWLGHAVTFAFKTSAPNTASPRAVPIAFSFKSGLINAQFEGVATRGDTTQAGFKLDGTSEVAVASLRRLVRALGGAWSDGQSFGRFEVAGGTTLSRSAALFEAAKVRIDEAVANGAFGLSVDSGRTVISGTLDFDSLDLEQYMGAQPPPTPTASYDRWLLALTDMMRTPLTRMFDADIRISASALSMGERDLGQAAASVILRDGRLRAQVAEFTLHGGTGSGQLAIDFNDPTSPRMTIRGKIESADLGQLSLSLASAKLIEGRGNVIADLTARGTDLAQLSATLGGRIHLKLDTDGVMRFDAAQVRNLRLKQKAVTPADAFGASIPLETFEVDAVLHAGVVFCRSAIAKGRERHLSVTGQLRLADGSMVLRLVDHAPDAAPAADKPPESRIATGDADLGKLEMLTIRGTLVQPRISVGADDFNAFVIGDAL